MAKRVASVFALWLLVAVAFYVGCIALLSMSPLPGSTGTSSFGFFVRALRSFIIVLPLLAGASLVPAALHLATQRLAWLWSWIFLAGSILLPAAYLLVARASYLDTLARYGHVDGVSLWNGVATVSFVSLYGAVVSLTFALLAAREGSGTRGRIMTGQVWAAAITTLLHVSSAATGFLAPVGWLHSLAANH